MNSYEELPPFFMVGSGEFADGIQSIDFMQVICEINKAEQLVIKAILKGLTWDNETGAVVIDMKEFTTTEKQTFSRGYSSLVKKDLVRRVACSTYMINPNALMTKDYEKALATWATLDNKAKKKADQPEG